MKKIKYLIIFLTLTLMVQTLFIDMQNHLLMIFNFLALISMSYYYHHKATSDIKKNIISLSHQLQQMIDFDFEKTTLPYDDELMSKLNHQIQKLSTILIKSHEIEHMERKRLESLISDISHQLKTPLANLKMYLSLLEEDSSLDNNENYLAMWKQLNRFEWLSNSLVKLSKIESGCINLAMKEHPLNDVILDAINSIHLKAKRKAINIDFKPTREFIRCDMKWTSESIYNILENAVKYSGKNTKITISVTHSELYTRVSIEDHGIGIKDYELNKIFHRFYRSPDVQNEEGVGIGLYLSQEIMNKQNGYIYATSNTEGSIFHINFKN